MVAAVVKVEGRAVAEPWVVAARASEDVELARVRARDDVATEDAVAVAKAERAARLPGLVGPPGAPALRLESLRELEAGAVVAEEVFADGVPAADAKRG